ncbi:hypothetical protein [Malacoplasma muris]|uniref:hypothetical protein n=1 Tax=Malacoplasma muris TaxID=2119 RepID=UPI00398E35D7
MQNLYLNGLIISAIIFVAPFIVTLLFYGFKIKLNQIKITYLYAFVTGLLLVLSIFGFIHESYMLLKDHFANVNQEPNMIIVVSVIVSGVIIGVCFGIFTKWIYFYKTKKQCKNHNQNIHGECVYEEKENPKFHDKLMSIIFLFIHNIIDGIILGFLLHNSGEKILHIENLGLLIGFVLHLIATTICIYYINLLKTNRRHNSFWISVSSNLIIVPFIFVGIAITYYSTSVYWLFPFLLSSTSGSLIFVSLMEFIPEFIHKHHLCTKEWFYMMIFITIGIVSGFALSLIHTH